jgi:hypothetical protein
VKIATLSYETNNIGDDVQTLAVEQHLPRVDFSVHREALHAYDGPEALVVMNGWFMDQPAHWPPSPAVRPLFFGFHVSGKFREAVARHADYLKAHEPIGCRDRGTRDFLSSLGLRAYLSLCATLTFEPAEAREPDAVYYVDADPALVDARLRARTDLAEWRASHRIVPLPQGTRQAYAREVLDAYRRRAAFVVTSRIHCAMPCAAMGVPVAYCGPVSERTEILEEIGVPRRRPPKSAIEARLSRFKTWPEPVDLSSVKARVRSDLRTRIAAALAGERVEAAEPVRGTA